MDEIIKFIEKMKQSNNSCYLSWQYVDIGEPITAGLNPTPIEKIVVDEKRRLITDVDETSRLLYHPKYTVTGDNYTDNGNQRIYYYYLTTNGDTQSKKYLEFTILEYMKEELE